MGSKRLTPREMRIRSRNRARLAKLRYVDVSDSSNVICSDCNLEMSNEEFFEYHRHCPTCHKTLDMRDDNIWKCDGADYKYCLVCKEGPFCDIDCLFTYIAALSLDRKLEQRYSEREINKFKLESEKSIMNVIIKTRTHDRALGVG